MADVLDNDVVKDELYKNEIPYRTGLIDTMKNW